MALPMTSAGLRWPLGPLGMDFLERLRVVGPAFVVFDLNVADAPLPPLAGYSDDVQDVGNARPEGRFPGNACEHEGGAFMHDTRHIGAGCDACHGPAPSATFRLSPTSGSAGGGGRDFHRPRR